MNTLNKIWNALEGHKTYIVAIAAVVYGAYIKDVNIIILGLGLVGIRHGVSTEVAKIIVSSDPVKTAEQEAPQIAAEVVAQTEQVVTPTPVEVPVETPTQQ